MTNQKRVCVESLGLEFVRGGGGGRGRRYTTLSNIVHMHFLIFKVLQGNTDTVNTEDRILHPPIIARFIKINVKAYQGYPSLRVELYGCRRGMPNRLFC